MKSLKLKTKIPEKKLVPRKKVKWGTRNPMNDREYVKKIVHPPPIPSN